VTVVRPEKEHAANVNIKIFCEMIRSRVDHIMTEARQACFQFRKKGSQGVALGDGSVSRLPDANVNANGLRRIGQRQSPPQDVQANLHPKTYRY
jgi:hypothetical protein